MLELVGVDESDLLTKRSDNIKLAIEQEQTLHVRRHNPSNTCHNVNVQRWLPSDKRHIVQRDMPPSDQHILNSYSTSCLATTPDLRMSDGRQQLTLGVELVNDIILFT